MIVYLSGLHCMLELAVSPHAYISNTHFLLLLLNLQWAGSFCGPGPLWTSSGLDSTECDQLSQTLLLSGHWSVSDLCYDCTCKCLEPFQNLQSWQHGPALCRSTSNSELQCPWKKRKMHTVTHRLTRTVQVRITHLWVCSRNECEMLGTARHTEHWHSHTARLLTCFLASLTLLYLHS